MNATNATTAYVLDADAQALASLSARVGLATSLPGASLSLALRVYFRLALWLWQYLRPVEHANREVLFA